MFLFKYRKKSNNCFIQFLGISKVSVVKIKTIVDFSFDSLNEKLKLNSNIVHLSFSKTSDVYLENSILVVFTLINVS